MFRGFRSVPKAFLLAPLALVALQPHAQQGKNRVGIVNVQSVVSGMPGGTDFVALSKKADADIQVQVKAVRALLIRANARGSSAADKSAYAVAAKKYQASAQSYQKQLASSFAPLAGRVNTAVTAVARAGGYSVVFDQKVARDNGVVIYANAQATDLTAAVTAKVKAGK